MLKSVSERRTSGNDTAKKHLGKNIIETERIDLLLDLGKCGPRTSGP